MPTALNQESTRPSLALETALRRAAPGRTRIAGVDEAGRGPLAGPVTAAAVILPHNLAGCEPWLQTINDSKRLTPAQRETAAALIRQNALASAVRHIPPHEIDRIGIAPAVRRAMLAAVAALPAPPHALLLDYIHIPARTRDQTHNPDDWHCPYPYQTIVKGDRQSLSIAAASILAKTARDALMRAADQRYPGYGFARHKGYATAHHRQQIARLGPSPIHRRTFRPLSQPALSDTRHDR